MVRNFNRADYQLESGKMSAYAFPGGYPIFYICADCEVLCADCANEPECIAADNDKDDKQWHLIGADINYEDDSMFCAHCNKQIESAYGAPDSEE